MISPRVTQPCPPRRIPSRSAARSLSRSPPNVPRHRGRRSPAGGSVSPGGTRYSAGRIPQETDTREGKTGSCSPPQGGGSAQRESLRRVSAADAAPQSAGERKHSWHSFMRGFNNGLPHQHEDGSIKGSHLDYVGYYVSSIKASSASCGDDNNDFDEQSRKYPHKINNTKQPISPTNRHHEGRHRDDFRFPYGGNDYPRRTTVTGLIDVIPSRWRLEQDPNAEVFEIQMRNIETGTYKAQKILQLIERSLPFCANDVSTFRSSTSLPPCKGSLFIYRKDNAHVPFQNDVPNAVNLKGSMVLDDIIDTKRLTPEGTKVTLRWIEDAPESFARHHSLDNFPASAATPRHSIKVGKNEELQFPVHDNIVQSSIKPSNDTSQQIPNNFNNGLGNESLEENNGYYKPQSMARHDAQKNQEQCNNYSNQRVPRGRPIGSPITFLHVPHLLYNQRL